MKTLSLKVKLYALVIALLLLMGLSMIITAQLSLADLEDRMTTDTREMVQTIVLERLRAAAGQYAELVSGVFNAA